MLDLRRFSYAITFAALDAVVPVYEDLWMPVKASRSLSDELARAAFAMRSSEDDYVEQALTLLSLSSSFVSRYGVESVQNFLVWVNEVVVKHGGDRAQEAMWRHVCYSFLYGRLDGYGWIADLLCSVAKLDKELTAEFSSRASTSGAGVLNESDLRVLGNVFCKPEDVDDVIQITVSANLFAKSWRDCASMISTDHLRELTMHVRSVSHLIQLDGSSLALPGLWELRYLGVMPKTLK